MSAHLLRAACAALRSHPDLAARVMMMAEPPGTLAVRSAADAFAAVYPLLAGLDHEALAVVALDRGHRVIGFTLLTHGSDAYTIVEPRQVFRWALRQGRSGASAIIVAHNHPSGNPSPSPDDLDVTARLAAAGALLGITLLDHLVIAEPGAFVSLAERGALPAATIHPNWMA